MTEQDGLPPAVRARLAAMASKAEASRPATGAERVAAMRARDKATGVVRPRVRMAQAYDPARSRFASGYFVGIDGEGVSEGIIHRFGYTADDDGPPTSEQYRSQPHYMILLAASDGSRITCSKGRLSAVECLDYLLSVQANHPKGILVCYGGSYDVNQMLLYGLPRKALRELGQGKRILFTLNGHAYKLEYRARKSLSIWRWRNEQIRPVVKGNRIVDEEPEARCVLWDTIGFFQSSFVTTMNKWLGADHPDLQFIEAGKDKRSAFTRDMLDYMIVYNNAECRALVEVMDRLKSAVERLDLVLSRWDGAGAVAAAMNKAHGVRLCKAESPEAVFEAARCAFSGGHIEVCRFGTFMETVHHYDINSAYPDAMRELPNLAGARWTHGTDYDPPPGFTLVRVRFEFGDGLPFHPLFFRCEDGSIIYPRIGEGWYWYPEFETARDFVALHGAKRFDVLEWHHCQPATPDKPFAFVVTYYERRKQYVALARQGQLTPETLWYYGAEKVIKLGINSLYGKTAQQVGGRDGEPPPYFQIEWAGYTTSATRAKMMRAAMQKPHAVISFATDGLFTTEKLDLETPDGKPLGAWEYQTHDGGMVVAMPGVYWLFDAGEIVGLTKPKPENAMSRGFDKASVETPEKVLIAWRDGETTVDIPTKRLVTIGSACAGDNREGAMWRNRGRFLEGMRALDISGSSVKREPPAAPRRGRVLEPWRTHYLTPPRENWRYLQWELAGSPAGDVRGCSSPYAIAWLEDGVNDRSDYEVSALEWAEMLDADDRLW